MRSLPSGTVTFLFTDVEGSTKLLDELGEERYATALAEHREKLRAAFTRHGGVEVDTQGDAFFFVFADPREAVAAAADAQHALRSGPIRVRMGLHSGKARLGDGGYIGREVHRGARIAALGHGGQVLLSQATRELVHADLSELGEHRLKDFADPAAIYQLGSERFPPLKSISNTNLPRPVSSFVGREREVADVVHLLGNGSRLVTLTGPGGSGKTRLALEAAAELVPQFKAGVFWVGLAALRDPALVPDEIAQTLGARDGLADHIAERDLLLLLDNLEQVVEAAPKLAQLLEACPNLKLLVTSRELLRIRGEIEYSVPPLNEEEAVELFSERAQRGADETVAELCRRLDNLPLAVELAAARARVMSPKQILDRLSKRLDLLKGGRDAEARQQTLRAAIEWSHDLLGDEEQKLFVRLAVFAGGSTLEAAEAVADADLDVLQSLVDKSLVRHTEERFWMLETIHEFAAERFAEDEERSQLRDRHLDFFLALAERAYEERARSAETWFRVMDDELDNFRAALRSAANSDPKKAAQLAGAVGHYWSLRGNVREARDHLERALARYTSPDAIRARVLVQHGVAMGMDPASVAPLQEALEIYRAAGDMLGEALALERLAYKHIMFREEDAARGAFERSIELRRAAGAPKIENWYALGGLCQLLIAAGDAANAEPAARELYRLGDEYGNLDTQGDALHYLADCRLIAGDYLEAERRYSRALAHARSCGIAGQAVEELRGIAMSLAGQGDAKRAVMLAALATAERETLGIRPLSPEHWWGKLQERLIGGARAQLTPDEVDDAERRAREADFDAVADELVGAVA